MIKIPFNKPFLSGNELTYIQESVTSGKISGDGVFTKKCHEFFEKRYGFRKCLLTTSCTDALEMCAILLNIEPGDEVIMPAYTFVSTANAFVLRGAKIIFVDSESLNPNVSLSCIEKAITPRTKAIVVVHYAGIACDMEGILALAEKNNLFVVEDAAQAIDSYFENRPLGSLGHLSAFSFHETKNINSGEGGMLVINDERFIERAEIIREKGTNRSRFFRGEVDKYGWVDIGSSFLPSDIIAAFLYSQLENLDRIQAKRKVLWNLYDQLLKPLAAQGMIGLPHIPEYATNNAHMYYIVCNNAEQRTGLIQHLKENGILSAFHYLSLNKSPFYNSIGGKEDLNNSDNYTECLLRLPLYYDLQESQVEFIAGCIKEYLA